MSNPFLRSLSRWINSSSSVFIFSFPEFKFSSAFSSEPPSKSSQALILFLHPSFFLITLLSPEFFMVVLHDLIHSSSFHQESRGEFNYLFFLRLEVQIILRILLKWSFAFLRSSQLSSHFRLWPVITLCSWDVTYKSTTSLFSYCRNSQLLR